MNRFLVYLLLAGFALVVQTALLPPLVPGYAKPDLILILVIYLGLHEKPLQGGIMVYLIGWLYDSFAGVFPGLHGFVLLSLFLCVRGVVTRVNTESSPLLLLLVLAGTALQMFLVGFALDFFRITYGLWWQLIWQLPTQLMLNTLAAFLLLRLTVSLQRIFMPRSTVPGLRKLDKRYES